VLTQGAASIGLALVAALAYGVSDFVGGVAARKVAALRVVIVSYPVSIVLACLVAPFAGGAPTGRSMLWGALAGAAGGMAILWFFRALASGPMAVVSPLTAVLAAGIPVLVGIVGGERPHATAYVGIALALVAVVLVSRESPDSAVEEVTGGRRLRFSPAVAWLTLGAGSAFALDFISLDHIGKSSGLWPLALSRLVATAVLWTIALSRREFHRPHGETLRLACYVGCLDVIANGALLYAYHGGMLSLVSVIGALYPAATVVLAVVMLGERVSRIQVAGLVLALAAVSLIALA
jgi:uncharacterized membrane protein